MDLLQTPDGYQSRFEEGLVKILDQGELGTFILATANAASDPSLHDRLAPRLAAAYDILLRQSRTAIEGGRPLPGSADDAVVFLKMACIGFDGLRPAEQKKVGCWRVQFNHLRSFRPTRMSAAVTGGLSRPFDPQGFHFNKPFIAKERIDSGVLVGRETRLLYNKYPFARLHALLVPSPEACRPQLLERADHEWAGRVAEAAGRGIPNIGIGYNSYGAFASVNHLHFHLFCGADTLPVTDVRWLHNGGGTDYPAGCMAFGDASEAWKYIEELHRSGTAYNLLYTRDRVYCMPRKHQGSYVQPPWTAGFAWHELSGHVITADRDHFEKLDAAAIEDAMAQLTPADEGQREDHRPRHASVER